MKVVKTCVAAIVAFAAPSALSAGTPQSDAAAHDAAFEAGIQTGITPETLSEMLTCSALWDRWSYAIESAADPQFTSSLRKELSGANAKMRSIYWQRQARRTVSDEEGAYFMRASAKAEKEADRLYAAYASNEERGMENLLDWLGVCR